MIPNYQMPYQTYPQFQPVQPQPQVGGKIVDDFNMIVASDIPMDGSPAFFIKRDMSEVQLRKWGNDGRIYTSTYKPYTEAQNIQLNNLPTEQKQSDYEAVTERLSAIEEKLDRLIKPTTAKKGAGTDANA